jgi:hypothetical protein
VVVTATFEDLTNKSSAALRSGQTEPDSEAECADALFSFVGHPGGLAVEDNGSILVSDTLGDPVECPERQ